MENLCSFSLIGIWNLSDKDENDFNKKLCLNFISINKSFISIYKYLLYTLDNKSLLYILDNKYFSIPNIKNK